MNLTKLLLCLFAFCLACADEDMERCQNDQYEGLGIRERAMDVKTVYTLRNLHDDVEVHIVKILIQPTVNERVRTYGCKNVGRISYPGYGGFAWLMVLPGKSTFSVVEDKSGSFFRDTAIQTQIASRKRPNGELAVLVSGPFWKLGQRGEVPIGALVVAGELRQSYREGFSARYVLCSREGGVDLIDPEYARLLVKNESASEHGTLGCSAAIQVGPAFIERAHDGTRLGIGGDSMNASRRNILVYTAPSLERNAEDTHLLLLSTSFDVGTYDAMVIVHAILDVLDDDVGKVAWAVGLVDDESLSGPAIVRRGRPPIYLAETARPTGAILHFDVP